jgi:anhydro-N-acetylmuramic acid kinase
MTGFSLGKLRKNKNRRIIVISAAGFQSGIQCIYFSSNSTWEILAHAKIPYPQKVTDILEKCISGPKDHFKISDLAWLDLKITQMMAECVKTTLAQVPRSISKPHIAVVNKLSLWKGPTGENCQQHYWDLCAGDPQYIASTFLIPVFSDFSRLNLIAGGDGAVPVNPGNFEILSKAPGRTVLINIGLLSHITILDTVGSKVILDSDIGPGTCLIDKIVRELSDNDNFDRDGVMASKGSVDGECLNTLVSSEWFLQNGQKTATSDQFDHLLEIESLKTLSSYDRLATVTALTARTIYNYYRSEYKESIVPERIFISGGGAFNLTLKEYLSAYFQAIPIKSIDELGIPVDMRIPLALGLTVNSFIDGANIPVDSGAAPKITSIGKWFYT